MGVKGDDVLDADVAQLLQRKSTVQAFAADTAMLAAAVQAGHDNADAVGAACNSLDQAHQVLEVVVRGEVVLIAEQLVGNAVIARIDEDIQVVAAGRGLDQALGVAGLETRAVRRDDEGVNIGVADAGQDSVQPLQVLLTSILYSFAAGRRGVPQCPIY